MVHLCNKFYSIIHVIVLDEFSHSKKSTLNFRNSTSPDIFHTSFTNFVVYFDNFSNIYKCVCFPTLHFDTKLPKKD